ncbi:hypothetical protein GPROT2_02830 [Gammaproteobacteria bacterium]|nr:hypothetical protein GPROT2_02830 [Gammaproteobacteria bacterium]
MVVADFDLHLSCDEVLRRLALDGPAFRARPARAMVAELLERIRCERLIRPRASYRCIGLQGGEGDGMRRLLEPGRRLPQRARAEFVLAAAWSLGPGVSAAVAQAFGQRRGLQALVLDELASLFVFRLGEQLFARLREDLATQGLAVGRPEAPGDGVVALTAQAPLLQLAGAGRIGITLAGSGVMSPLKTATALAPVGRQVRPPRQDRPGCACASGARCRFSRARSAGTA